MFYNRQMVFVLGMKTSRDMGLVLLLQQQFDYSFSHFRKIAVRLFVHIFLPFRIFRQLAAQ